MLHRTTRAELTVDVEITGPRRTLVNLDLTKIQTKSQSTTKKKLRKLKVLYLQE